jgi:hypothetical protein
MTPDNNSPFGHYSTLEERLQELANRLHAWHLSGEQLPELFNEAERKMAATLDDYVDPMDAPKETVLEAFESALTDFDNILRAFPETVPDWNENIA